MNRPLEASSARPQPRGTDTGRCDCAPPVDKIHPECDRPVAAVVSPLSVAEVFQDEQERQQDIRKPKVLPVIPRSRRRGVDSPMKLVQTRNVYASALTSNSKKRTVTTTTTSLLVPPVMTATANTATTNTAVQEGPPLLPPLSAAPSHRRQDTCDSTHSKVAAVLRGASKAAAEVPEEQLHVLLDRPAACPQRQYTGGSTSLGGVSDISCEMSMAVAAAAATAKNTPARIRRPPRRDTVLLVGNPQASIQIQRMKNIVLPRKGGEDKPAPCPMRQSTMDRSLLPERDVCVTPKALLTNFDRQSQTSADTRDDQDDESSSWTLHHGETYFNQPSPHPTSQIIQTWLNMNHQNQQHNSNLTVQVAPMTPKPITFNAEDDERTFGEGSVLLNTPHFLDGDDTTANETSTSCEDRRFQAYLKLPPRACTTPKVTFPLHTDTGMPPLCPSSRALTPVVQTPKLVEAETPIINRRIVTDLCLDVSAMEMSMDFNNLSLPSFFEDCRGQVEVSTGTNSVLPSPIVGTATPNQVTSIPDESFSSRMSLTLEELAVEKDLQRRRSLPPTMPHRRKPSLHVGGDDDDDDEEAIALQTMWSSMPIVLPGNPKANTNTSMGLRSSWPRMQEDSLGTSNSTAVIAPPTIPNRFRRQDSLLSTEAGCETMARPSTGANMGTRNSPPRRALPRQPSLTLQDISPRDQEEEHCNQNYVANQPNLWSSLPVFGRSQQSLLPPVMPPRRKPSLNILQGDQEGRIEMWLSSDGSINNNSKKGPPQRQNSFSSVGSIILKEGEVEI